MISKVIKIDEKSGLGPSWGLSGETWGPFWSQDGPRLGNGTKSGENLIHFYTNMETRTSFSWSCSLLFCGVLVFEIFNDFGCEKSPFPAPFFALL